MPKISSIVGVAASARRIHRWAAFDARIHSNKISYIKTQRNPASQRRKTHLKRTLLLQLLRMSAHDSALSLLVVAADALAASPSAIVNLLQPGPRRGVGRRDVCRTTPRTGPFAPSRLNA